MISGSEGLASVIIAEKNVFPMVHVMLVLLGGAIFWSPEEMQQARNRQAQKFIEKQRLNDQKEDE